MARRGGSVAMAMIVAELLLVRLLALSSAVVWLRSLSLANKHLFALFFSTPLEPHYNKQVAEVRNPNDGGFVLFAQSSYPLIEPFFS